MGPTEENRTIGYMEVGEEVKQTELHDLKPIEEKHLEIMGDINILSDVLTLENKYGRNNICFCGSGKKFKKCCLPAHEEKERKLHSLHLDIQDIQFEYAKLKKENMEIEKQNRKLEEVVVPKVVYNTSNINKEEGDTSG